MWIDLTLKHLVIHIPLTQFNNRFLPIKSFSFQGTAAIQHKKGKGITSVFRLKWVQKCGWKMTPPPPIILMPKKFSQLIYRGGYEHGNTWNKMRIQDLRGAQKNVVPPRGACAKSFWVKMPKLNQGSNSMVQKVKSQKYWTQRKINLESP